MNNIGQQILQEIERFLNKKISNIYYDKTFPSVIYGKNDDGTYKIPYEGHLYNVPCSLGIDLKITQNVWITIPCGQKNFKDMYISGIRGKVFK